MTFLVVHGLAAKGCFGHAEYATRHLRTGQDRGIPRVYRRLLAGLA